MFVMNDYSYDSDTFKFHSNSFVHVTRVNPSHSACPASTCVCENELCLYTCECRGYRLLCSSGYPAVCLHTKFLMEHVFSSQSQMEIIRGAECNPSDPALLAMLKRSVSTCSGRSVVRIDEDSRYHRFSVLSDASPSLVNLDLNSFKCMRSVCQAKKGSKRKVKYISDQDVCEHLRLMNNNKDMWENLMPDDEVSCA